jgi:hypothetical protein
MKKSPSDNKNDDKRFDLLRELLLEEDREKINALNEEIRVREKVSARVDPIIDEKIEDLRKNFPEYFGDTITETIKTQIRDSQDEVVDALYPIMGKMIKKFIMAEIRKLSENINQKVKKTFSFREVFNRFKRRVSGVSDGDAILKDAFQPKIEEVFVIDKDSGILLGNHSTGNIANKDMVSGMLTAIKAFAEDAFSKEGQNLEDVKFETFQILLYNFNTVYIAVAVSGVLNTDYKDKLVDRINDFAEDLFDDRADVENESKLNEMIVDYLIKEDLN